MRKLALAVLALLAAVVAAIALAACGGASPSSGTGTSAAGNTGTSASGSTGTSAASSSAPAIGFEGVPLQQGPAIAPASTTGTATVNGITCGPTEQLVYHIHARLSVFKSGQSYVLPAGVGIPGSKAEHRADQ